MTAHFDGPAPLTDTITPQVPDRPRPAGPGDSGDLAGFAPDGPLFARTRPVAEHVADSSLFVPALTRPQRFETVLYSLLWLVTVVVFWVWWADPAHILGPWAYALNTALLAYLILLPAVFVYRMQRLRKVRSDAPVPDLRVAFAVTRAPSEGWDVVGRTLRAMLDQDIPIAYDVWLCDEAPTPEIREWCVDNGVRISTRNGIEEYHRAEWPRRTRCKEGNLAYFYDTVGYRDYDVVAQLDCDHVPERGYLAEMVKPFADPGVGFVAAPSVCDSNAATSWAARGRLWFESFFHGAFQLAHNGGAVPVSIGSHYAVRTSALREVGGIGPELAEDFSTSYILRLGGYDGVFAIDARAHGLWPDTCAAMLTQEFQWTRSLTAIALTLVPRTLRRVPMRLRLRFFFAVTHNAVFGLFAIVGFLLAPMAVIFDHPWVSVNFLEFLLLTWLTSLPLIGIVLLLRSAGLLRPDDAPVLSWETALYKIARLPYLWRGALAGIVQATTGKITQFRVTPKDREGIEPYTVGQVMPYVVLTVANVAVGAWGTWADRAFGYAGLTLLAAVSFAVVAIAVPALHARELRAVESAAGPRWKAVAPALTLALAVAAPTFAVAIWYCAELAALIVA